MSQWLLRQRYMRFISVPPKPTDKKVTHELHDVASSSPCCDSGLSLSSVASNPPAARRVLRFNNQAELKEQSTVDASAIPVSTESSVYKWCACT